MAKCLNCGNTTNFNVWCTISKILEVELDEQERIKEVLGEPEDEELRNQEECWVAEDDLELAMVNCAWCGSTNVLVEKFYTGTAGKATDD